jgi:hypothetical protein
MHDFSSVYSIIIPVHVLGLLVVHYEELTGSWPVDSQLKRTARAICCIYTLLPPDDGQLESPKHVDV